MVQAEAAGAASQMQLLTESCSGTYSWIRWVYIHLLVTLVFSAQAVLSGKIVKFLPGYDGELPFKLETGYISVDDSELFYYFVESEGNPQEDPLFLWLTGGPGCSSFSGLIYEAGPMEFDFQNFAGGLPKLKYYPYRWTKAASMIFLDSPVGTGFSYARNPEGWHSSDTKSVEHSYQFLGKWMIEHPQFLSVQLFIAGDSYAGIPVPLITKKIIDGNKDKDKLYLNIKGYLIGSPWTDSSIDTDSKVEFAHRTALISDEIYENARRSCKEDYVNVDPENAACSAALGDIQMCVKDLYDKDILKPNCDLFSPEIGEDLDRKSLEEGASGFLQSQSMNPRVWCNDFMLLYGSIWHNDDSVQEALHVRKGTIRQWERCNYSISYTKDVPSVVPVHIELSRSALEVLVESGDHDMAVPYVGTLKWIKSLNLTLVDNWRPWFIDHQVAGYTMKYSDQGYHLTFATVKGAGHPAPEFYRRECYYLFDRWVNYRPI
ncbi:serine carboxypeptidase-like 17 isoform X1 [Rhododendron vialii]|uniref:serine carboxypeptidase-like 17 isoform X1 n=1 Tax=Rhododendron vialii TaxID=182163 RepID=UPI00265E3DA2|nr:serine carboxypeptidase-like 17 isoform X1 [Rhododendron vialii]